MDVKSEIIESFEENKNIFLVVIVIFIIGMIIAWVFSDAIAPVFLPILQEALLEDNGSSLDAFSILYHNLNSAITTFAFSIFFGIYPIISSFINGFAIGFLGGLTVKTPFDLLLFLVLILPHGVLEIPAIFCECTSGILLFLFIFRTLKDKIQGFTFKEAYGYNKDNIKHSLVLFLVSMVLFIIAAFIEGFITPFLGNLVSMMLTGSPIF